MSVQTQLNEYFETPDDDIDELINIMYNTRVTVPIDEVISNYRYLITSTDICPDFVRNIQKTHSSWVTMFDEWDLSNPEHMNIRNMVANTCKYPHNPPVYDACKDIIAALEAILVFSQQDIHMIGN